MWRTKNGETVVDRHNSHLHDGVSAVLPEALLRIDPMGKDFLVEEVTFSGVIGETTCVATGAGDQVVFAQRLKRFGLTRFVKGKSPEPCKSIVVILKKVENGYVLITAFIGHKAEPEPWDRNATPASKEFWSTHALVWGSEEIIPGTQTDISPW